jgi:Fungal specific transcription factor domain
MKRMQGSISLNGNPIFDALSRKHYPQILQIGNEQGDLPIVEMLGPSAYEEGGQYFHTDANGTPQSPDLSVSFRNRRDSRTEQEEATETEIILEGLLSLGASSALELQNAKHQASMFNPPSYANSDSRSLTRSDGAYTPDRVMQDSFSPFPNGAMEVHSHELFEEPLFVNGGEMYPPALYRTLPPIAPPGISTENERRFLHHYLYVISARITAPDRGVKNPFRNSFARLATDFPPLLHGILAISAADLTRFDRNITSYEAFLHYQGCISMLASALNEPATMIGDEALATICLLFLHEVVRLLAMLTVDERYGRYGVAKTHVGCNGNCPSEDDERSS